VADVRQRELEREAAGGSASAWVGLLRERLRAGARPDELELAAHLLYPDGEAALGAPIATLPRARFAPGASIRLETLRRAPSDRLRLDLTLLDPPARSALVRLATPGGSRSTPYLGAALDEIQHLGLRRLVVDLTACATLSSTGISLLLRVSEGLAARGGLVVLVLSRPIGVIFGMLGIEPICTIAPDVAGARARLAAEPAPLPPPSPRERLEQLARWGPAVCVRAALAAARPALPAWGRWRTGELDAAPTEAIARAEAWLRCPCPEHALEAAEAGDAALEAARTRPAAEARAGLWAGLAGRVAADGTWPTGEGAQLPVDDAAAAAVREALVPWALGLA